MGVVGSVAEVQRLTSVARELVRFSSWLLVLLVALVSEAFFGLKNALN